MVEQITWTAADGTTVIDFTDGEDYNLLGDGMIGLRSVGYEMTSVAYAGIDGDTITTIRALPNTPTLGLLVQASGDADFRAKVRGLVHAMRPKAGMGTLTAANETGARSLPCYCVGGYEGDESPEVSGPGRWWKLALKFHAPDPWWLGDSQTMLFGLGAPTSFFPIFPLVLSPSTIQGQFTVDLSDADDGGFPVWTVKGPGTGLVLTNQTTGRSLTINATLAGTDTLIVDTRPGNQFVRKGDGTNLLGSVQGYPDLWPLESTVNTVSAALTGATSASQITGSFAPRYAGI